MDYQSFIENKIIRTESCGFVVKDEDLNPILLPHQRDVVKWAAEGGKRAIFASFGMGKTIMQLELARLCLAQSELPHQAILVMPLGVKQEFKKDAAMLGIEVEYVRTMDEARASACSILLTNYERILNGDIDPKQFLFASLDEASVLRSYGSKTYQEFLPKFSSVPYRFVCTATPAPNRYKELIHYAGFLGIMDTGQALTRWFKRDSTKANNLTLYEHKEQEFWLWMASWAIFLTKPSDLGYSDEGYDLPEVKVIYHRIDLQDDKPNADRDGQTKLIRDAAIDLSGTAREKRLSLDHRVKKAQAIVYAENADEHWLIWHHLEDERRAIEKVLPDALSVFGSQPDALKEERLIAFGNGEYPILATKPEIAGQGCNFQKHCHRNIFLGINYKFNDFIQAIHRTQRFQQQHPVEVHIIYTDSEENVLKTLLRKWDEHKALVEKMTDIIKTYGLSQASMIGLLKRSIGIERKEVTGKNFRVALNDTVLETRDMESNSMGLVCTSIPFSNHYEYTPSYNDFGHTNNDDHFFNQMDFLTPELLRVLQPGRVAAIHVKDRIMFGSVTGYGMPSVNPFHAKTIFHYIKHGFIYMGMITIETDVVRENNQTYRLGWTEKCKDGSKIGVGSPEYLLLFRKLPSDTSNAYADEPVTKMKQFFTRGRWQIDARAKWNSSGDRILTPQEIARLPIDKISSLFSERMQSTIYDYKKHTATADAMDAAGKLPATFESLKITARSEWVWSDINRMITLNSRQTQSREQNHICPFQLDIVDRVIDLFSNEGDWVYDCFGGLMSVPRQAILKGRKGRGVELNSEYFQYGQNYCREAEYKKDVPTLFDTLELAV